MSTYGLYHTMKISEKKYHFTVCYKPYNHEKCTWNGKTDEWGDRMKRERGTCMPA